MHITQAAGIKAAAVSGESNAVNVFVVRSDESRGCLLVMTL